MVRKIDNRFAREIELWVQCGGLRFRILSSTELSRMSTAKLGGMSHHKIRWLTAKGGKFFASSFVEAEFYGRPLGSGMLKTSLKSGQLKRFSGLPPDEGPFPRHRGIYPLFACSLRL